MGLGVLEVRGTTAGHHVPGTVLLDSVAISAEALLELEAAGLKKATGKNAKVILVPQPSSDPNDPLNWPLWQRDLILLLYCYCTLCCIGGVGPIVSSMVIPLIAEFHITYTQASLLLGYQLCAVGSVGIVISACARKFGKRPTLLWSITCAFAGTLWASFAQSYGSLMGARVVQGLGIAMFESVTFALIGDMYHIHQRGTRMTLYIMAQSGIAQLPAVVAGKICVELGWRWVFYLLSIFMGVAWVLAILFGFETVYNRRAIYNLDTGSRDRLDITLESKGDVAIHEEETIERVATTMTAGGAKTREAYIHRIRPYHGTFSDDSLWKMVLRPFSVLINPIVLWSCIVIAFTTVWIIVISFVIAQAFSGPPYLLSIPQQGYISAGPAVGGFLGCIACGLVCDPIARYLTKKNQGVYEPEFRLPMMIVVPVVSTLGYFLFGNLIQEGQSPVGASVMFGLVFVSVQFAAVSTGAYIVDAFRDISVEVFIISMTLKNFVFFGFTFFLNDWFATAGPAKMFDTIGGVQLALSLTTIPIYIFGKRIRAWWHAHDVLRNK